MIILIGPSASGKTTIANKLIEKYGFKKFVTNTTRSPRVGEVDGIDYHFISFDTFKEKDAKGLFIESISYHDNYYATSIEEVSDDKVLVVDILGGNKFYERLKDEVCIFYLSCEETILEERMISRGDSIEQIRARMSGDKEYFDIKHLDHYDYLIDNNVIGLDEVCDLIYNKYLEHKNRR